MIGQSGGITVIKGMVGQILFCDPIDWSKPKSAKYNEKTDTA